jgi:hypothetical protein
MKFIKTLGPQGMLQQKRENFLKEKKQKREEKNGKASQ